MFECKVPELMFSFIDINNAPYLCNRAIELINSLLTKSAERDQQRILALLKKNNLFFKIFLYIRIRLEESKKILLTSVKHTALNKFVKTNIKKNDGQDIKITDQSIYLNE